MAALSVQMADFPASKLGNGLFRLLFLHLLQDERQAQIRLAPLVADSPVTMLHNEGFAGAPLAEAQRLSFVFDELSRAAGPEPDMDAVEAASRQHGGAAIDLYGFFQYHTGHLRKGARPALIRELFSPHHPALRYPPNRFKQVLTQNLGVIDALLGGRPLLTVHVRRGDYVALEASGRHPLFFGASIEAVIAQARRLVAGTGLAEAVIYLASDDLPYCLEAFGRAGLRVISSQDLFPPQTRPSADTLLLTDMAMMVRADFLIAANSSLSVFASLLNETGRVFMRPDPAGDGLMPFHPWNTPVLCARAATPR